MTVELNDSEILKLEKVIKWAEEKQQTNVDIDQFTKDVEERVNECGFTCEVKVFDTQEPGVYGFEIELNGRVLGAFFDPDRQVHEVTNNLLQLPGQDTGFIPSKEYIDKLAQRELRKKQHKH